MTEDETTKEKTEDVQSTKKRKVSAVLVVLVIMSMLGMGYFVNQSNHEKNVANTAKTDAISKQKTIDGLAAKVTVLEKGKETGTSQAAYYDIPELKIKIKLDSKIQDLVYAYDQKIKAAYFYSRDLAYRAAVDNKSDTGTVAEGSLGAVSVQTKAELSSCMASCGEDIKDLGNGYHVIYTHVQGIASENKSTQAKVNDASTSLVAALKNAVSL